jgi:hypothetical protein
MSAKSGSMHKSANCAFAIYSKPDHKSKDSTEAQMNRRRQFHWRIVSTCDMTAHELADIRMQDDEGHHTLTITQFFGVRQTRYRSRRRGI